MSIQNSKLRVQQVCATGRGRGALPVFILLSCALFLFLHASPAQAQTEASHQQFLFAYKLLQRGDNALAADEFDKYLGEFPAAPKRGDAVYYRALLHRRAGQNEAAAALLENVPDPQLVPPYAVHLLRGQVLSDLKQYDTALEVLEKIDLDALDPQIAVSVHYLKGLVYRSAGNLDAAAEALAAAAEPDTSMRARALLDLARVRAQQNRRDEAIQTLQRCIELADNATVANAARLAGDLSYELDQHDQAISFYSRVLNNHQSSRHFSAAVVGTLWAHFSAERYRAVLETFEQHGNGLSAEERLNARYLAGAAHQELGEHGPAVELLSQAADGDNAPIQERILYRLAVSQYELERYDAMRQTVEALSRRFPQSDRRVEAAYMLAAAEAETGNLQQGASRLSALIEQGEAYPYYRSALLRRARLYDDHNEPAAAARDYGRYVAASRAADDVSDTVRRAALRQINLLYRLEQHEPTRQAAAALLDQPNLDDATEQEALYHHALAELRLGEHEAALARLQQLDDQHEVHPYRAESLYYRGVLHMSLGQSDQAAPILERAADQDELPDARRASALRLLAIHQRRTDQPTAVLRQTFGRLEELIGRANLNTSERLWLGRDALAQGGEPALKRAVAYLDPVTDPAGNSEPAQRTEAMFLLGQAMRALGRHDAAVSAFQRVTAMGEGFGMRAQLEMAQTLREAGDPAAAVNAYAGPANDGSDELAAQARYGLGRAHRELADQAQRDSNANIAQQHRQDARSQFKRIALLYTDEQFEPLPQLAYIELAELALETEQVDEARTELEELIDSFSAEGEADDAYVVYGRAMLAESRQRFGEAEALLQRLRDGADDLDPRLQRRIAAALSRLEGRR